MSNNNKQKLSRLLEGYARFVTRHRLIILTLVILFTIFSGYQATTMETTGMSQEDMLPEDIEVVETFELIADQFVGSFSGSTIIIESEPSYANSSEIRDMRDPEIIQYAGMLEERAELIHGVTSAESAATAIRQANDGRIPSSLKSVKLLLRENEVARNQVSNYINDDYSMTIVRLNILEDADSIEMAGELKELIKGEKPPGVEVEITGDPIIEVTMMEIAQETMDTTTLISFSLILIILVIVFASVRHGLIPLLTIVFGIIWSYGTLTLAGFEVNPQTSGVMAMIMGIGIDFGIQVSKRFRYELGSHHKDEAMVNTLNNVFYPMFITTLAAVIGFKSLSLGNLPMMADMGTMMAVGVVFCMASAVTVVPVFLLLFERGKGQPKNART
ncbi:MAG: efflux RND transporter permease subunit [Archaeoglobaceae archaeon]